MKKLLWVSMAIMIVAALVFGACASQPATPAPTTAPTAAPTSTATTAPTTAAPKPTTTAAPATKPITLTAATFLGSNMFAVKGIHYLVENVPKKTNGMLNIRLLGGPEVVAGFDQPEAVRKGVLDMAVTVSNYYEGYIPVGNMPNLSLMTPEEEEKSGATAYMNELHEAGGLHMLWRSAGTSTNNNFMIVSKKKVINTSELAKLKLGATAPFLKAYMQSIGSSVVIVTQPEAYTALERGVTDAHVWPLFNSTDLSFQEITKFIIEPGFMAGNAFYIVNPQKWNSLPKALQDGLLAAAKEQRIKYQEEYDAKMKVSYDIYKKAGGEAVKLTDADAFFKAVYDESWKEQVAKYPVVAPKFRTLVTPK